MLEVNEGVVWCRFGPSDGGEKAIASLGDEWWPQWGRAGGEGDREGVRNAKGFRVMYGKHVIHAQVPGVPLSRVGMVFRLESDVSSMSHG